MFLPWRRKQVWCKTCQKHHLSYWHQNILLLTNGCIAFPLIFKSKKKKKNILLIFTISIYTSLHVYNFAMFYFAFSINIKESILLFECLYFCILFCSFHCNSKNRCFDMIKKKSEGGGHNSLRVLFLVHFNPNSTMLISVLLQPLSQLSFLTLNLFSSSF